MIKLILGDYTFTRLEIPGNISLGGDQKLVIHELVGGTRIIDAMGKTYDPIKWNGLFLGEDALQKAKYLDQLRKSGTVLPLNWSSMNYSVIIQQFQFNFEKEYKIPYHITCIVIADLSDPPTTFVVDVDQAMLDDLGDMIFTVDNLKDSDEVSVTKIKSSFDRLKDSFKKVVKFVRATQAQVKDIKGKIEDVQKEVTTAIAATSNTIQNITTLGGILPNNPVSMNALKLTHNTMSLNNHVQLMNLKYTLTKMNKNVITQSPTTVSPSVATESVMPGMDLFKLSAKYYNDATKWQTIATANKLTSPYITTNMTLVIPKTPMMVI